MNIIKKNSIKKQNNNLAVDLSGLNNKLAIKVCEFGNMERFSFEEIINSDVFNHIFSSKEEIVFTLKSLIAMKVLINVNNLVKRGEVFDKFLNYAQ